MLLLLLGASLRLGELARDVRFHPDEALFASLARRMVLQDDFTLSGATTDKPPVTFLLVGASLVMLGENEFAARLPAAFASLIELAAFYGLARRCTGETTLAVLALLLLVLAPIDIAFAPTVFQDTPALAGALLAAWFAGGRRWGAAGLAFGLAISMKPTALWLLPLVIGIGLAVGTRHGVSLQIDIRTGSRRTASFAAGLAIPVLAVLLWDMSRPQQSLISLGMFNNNPGRLIRSDEVWPRAEVWLRLLVDLAGSRWLAALFLLAGLTWLAVSASRRPRSGLVSWLIAGYLVWYLGLYWLVAFNPWHRYLYLVAPFVLWIAAQGIGWAARRRRWGMVTGAALILVAGWQPAAQATRLNQDSNPRGIDELAAILNRDFAGTIVYDYWLGWELGWYLGRDPAVWPVYFSTPEDLAAHLQTEEGARYFVAPSAELAHPWVVLLRTKGVQVTPVRTDIAGHYVIYCVLPPKDVN